MLGAATGGGGGGGGYSISDTTNQAIDNGPVTTGAKYIGSNGNPNARGKLGDDAIKLGVAALVLGIVVVGGIKLAGR